MKLGLYMATQWRQGADLGPELANLIEQVRAARASGLASLMVGQHFVSSPLQMFQAMPLLARLAAEAEGMQLGPGLLLLPLLNPVIVAEETATLDWLCGGRAIIGLGLGYRPEEFDSIGVPRTRTPYRSRTPRSASSTARFKPVWPPRPGRSASGRSSAILAKAVSKSFGPCTSCDCSVTPSARAARSVSLHASAFAGLVPFHRTAVQESRRSISLSTSRRFAVSSPVRIAPPVTLPPGCARPLMSPVPTGSIAESN